MTVQHQPRGSIYRVIARRLILLVLAAVMFAAPVAADGNELVPNTKLRVKAIQWNPAKGEYIQWDAISGEFTVAEDGTLFLPLLGAVPVEKLDNIGLADDIAKRLKAKVALINAPDVSVEIIDYPPVYVVGIVASPGEYRFRPGMTVLQALALGGGLYRQPAGAMTNDQFSLLGELQGVQTDILRAKARIARLQAELAGEKAIDFPADLTGTAATDPAGNIVAQEQRIFSSRENAQGRQLKTLSELQELYKAEIGNLQQKLVNQETNIKRAEDELSRIGKLVDQGILTVSRRSELERQLSDARLGYLDLQTAIMRARQNLAESTRSSLGLHDQRFTGAATELQEAQTNLERLRGRQEVLQRLLTMSGGQQQAAGREDSLLAFKIVRRINGEISETEASGSTVLLPGDVVEVSLHSKS
jgi:protein involved in polysaccharide export with SLBB domain